MANDNKVTIEVEVIATGLKATQDVSNELAKMQKTSKTTSDTANETTKSTDKFGKSLTQMIPELKILNPLLGAAGLSGILTAGLLAGVGLAVGALVKLASVLDDLMSTMTTFGAISNQYTLGPMMDFGQTLRMTSSLALQLGIPLRDVAEAMSNLDQMTRSTNISESILNDAMTIQKATGIPLKTVLEDLTDAYNGEYVNGQFMMGDAAINQVSKDLMAQSSAYGSLKGSLSDYSSQGLETLKTLGGAIGEFFLIALQQAASFFSPSYWTDQWNDLVKAWNSGIAWLSPLWKNFLPSLKQDWDSFVKVTEWLTKMGQDAYNWLIGDGLNWFKNGIGVITNWIGGVFSSLWSSITSTFSNLFGSQSSTPPPSNTSIPGQKDGGVTTKSGLSWVGENGPELLSLPVGATVSPLSGGGAGGMNVYVNNYITGSVTTEQDLSTTISKNIMDAIRGRGGY